MNLKPSRIGANINGGFDIVTEDCFEYVSYKAKFKKDKISKKDIVEEIQQVNSIELNCYKYVFISKSGFSCVSVDNVELRTLDQLFK